MNSKNNRVNHDFQLAYFLAGSCHTADGAYALLCDLREDREGALAYAKAGELRAEAKLERISIALASDDKAARLDAEADLVEHKWDSIVKKKCVAGAEAELEMIIELQRRLHPYRVFAHLPDAEAHEAAQVDEWKLELMHRAQNSLFTTGSVDPELLNTMRMHPLFAVEMMPTIQMWVNKLRSDSGHQAIVHDMVSTTTEWKSKLNILQLEYQTNS
jgi:hypothetical protein